MMQENNNFDTIISTWRRMSGEQTESVTVSMSGDSSDLRKKIDEEASLLVPERLKGPIATVASAGPAAALAEAPAETADLEEKLLKRDYEDSNVFQKEAAGDANDKDFENKEAFDRNPDKNKDVLASNPDEKKEKSADRVDSMMQTALKVPPQSTTSTPEEEDCATKCLYYTLQCCDCILM